MQIIVSRLMILTVPLHDADAAPRFQMGERLAQRSVHEDAYRLHERRQFGQHPLHGGGGDAARRAFIEVQPDGVGAESAGFAGVGGRVTPQILIRR